MAALTVPVMLARRLAPLGDQPSSRWSWRVLATTLACAALVPLVPAPWGAVLFVIGAGAALAGTVYGMVSVAPVTRGFLAVFVAAGACFLVGIVLRPSDALSAANASWAADAMTFAGYVGLLVFLVRLLHSSRTPPASVVLDVVAVTCAASLLAWVFLADPALHVSGRSTVDGIRSTAYVAADVLLLAVLVQMGFRRTAMVPASLMTAAGMFALLSGDMTYALVDAGWQVAIPERYWSLWYLLAYGLFGAMALHPSLGRFVVPDRRSSWASERARFAVLLVALMVPVAMPVVEPPTDRADEIVRVVVSALVAAVVFVRLVMTAAELSDKASLLRRAEKASRTRAERDALTGLLNRATVLDRIDQALPRAAGPLHLLYVDLDGFKPINDTWGHTAGDAVLADVAARFRAALVGGELIGRVGGDEFIVLTDRDPAAAAARLRHSLTEPFALSYDMRRTVTASVGVARATAGCDAEQLMQRADVAMYSVKNAHRDGVAEFTEQMRTEVSTRAVMVSELRDALGTSELSMHFQPVIDAASGALRGHEALLRWHSPRLGAVPPDQAVAAAEGANLMGALGEWILRASLAELAGRLSARPELPVFMSINVSARQLEDAAIVSVVRDLLAEHGLDPASVWLELSESIAWSATSRAAEVAHQLRGLGVQIALDDFGTGYAALTQIRQLRPDVVKIDRSFVSGDGDGVADAPVVAAVVAMSHAVGAVVVAEGVETPEQSEGLVALGCDLLQGYLLGRPAPGLVAASGDVKVMA